VVLKILCKENELKPILELGNWEIEKSFAEISNTLEKMLFKKKSIRKRMPYMNDFFVITSVQSQQAVLQ
jgi:hypothetical protein